jgi:hypothetical protein
MALQGSVVEISLVELRYRHARRQPEAVNEEVFYALEELSPIDFCICEVGHREGCLLRGSEIPNSTLGFLVGKPSVAIELRRLLGLCQRNERRKEQVNGQHSGVNFMQRNATPLQSPWQGGKSRGVDDL